MKNLAKEGLQELIKSTIKELHETDTQVKIKQVDGKWRICQTDTNHYLDNNGYETKELAQHAALTKGFSYSGVEEDSNELSEPLKATKREKTKGTDKPEELKLGKETTKKLEEIIRRVIKEEKNFLKKRLLEVDVTDSDLEAKAKRYAEIAQQMKVLEEQLKNLEGEYEELDTEFRPLLEQVGKTKGTFIRAGKLLIKIEREGYDKKSKSYKTGFDYLYKKVNATMKELADDALKMTETVSYVKSKISVVEEGRLNENWFSKIKSFLSNKIKKLFGLNNRANKELDELESQIS